LLFGEPAVGLAVADKSREAATLPVVGVVLIVVAMEEARPGMSRWLSRGWMAA
jgi:hypothetical protein